MNKLLLFLILLTIGANAIATPLHFINGNHAAGFASISALFAAIGWGITQIELQKLK